MDYKTPMKIALLVERFTPSRGGGAGYCLGLARGLLERGHQVHVFAHDVEAVDPGIMVHRVPALRLTPGLRILTYARRAKDMVRDAGPFDIVHAVGKASGMNVYNPHGGVEMAWLAQQARSISNPAARAWFKARRLLSFKHSVVLNLERRAVLGPGTRVIIAIADKIKQDLIAWHGVPEDRVAVVYNTVDIERFHPRCREHRRDFRRQHALADDDFVLLILTHNFRLKGVATLVRAVALLNSDREFDGGPRVRAVIVGRDRPGPYRRLARRLGAAADLRFAGTLKDTRPAYGAADLYVHPTFHDACSLVVLEAMACGLPAITTRYNGAAGLISEGLEGAVLADPEDARALARRVAWFFDPVRMAAARAAARGKMERHCAVDNTDRVLEVYKQALSGPAVLPRFSGRADSPGDVHAGSDGGCL